MRPNDTVLIAGAGLAGARCAEALRGGGYGGRIVLAGEEPVPPYERPALSKELLSNERSVGDLHLRPREFWCRHGIELLLGARVERLDVAAREARLTRARIVRWDAAVIATGARPRRLPLHPHGVYTLRRIGDALALRRELMRRPRLVVVGGGFVGTEVASTAVGLGASVTLVDSAELPLAGTLGREVGALMRDRYAAHGVALRLGARVARVRAGANGRVEAVELTDGSSVGCDTVLVGIGIWPAAELLGGGARSIATDAAGRTHLPGVFACGDVAAPWSPSLGTHVAVGHWTAAAHGGRAVAQAILGATVVPPEQEPYFWSDQFGLRLQYAGHRARYASVALDGSVNSFTARYFGADGRLVAVLAANRAADVGALRRELAAAA